MMNCKFAHNLKQGRGHKKPWINNKKFRMKKLTVTLTLAMAIIFSVSHLVAQDATATQILNNVSRTYQTYKTIKAGFSITINNTQTKSKIKQNGTL